MEPELFQELMETLYRLLPVCPRLGKPKQAIKLRLDVGVMEAFKSTG